MSQSPISEDMDESPRIHQNQSNLNEPVYGPIQPSEPAQAWQQPMVIFFLCSATLVLVNIVRSVSMMQVDCLAKRKYYYQSTFPVCYKTSCCSLGNKMSVFLLTQMPEGLSLVMLGWL